MASLTFELEQFSKGYFLAWIVTTQCWNKVEVTLKVGNTEYLHASKTNRSTGLQGSPRVPGTTTAVRLRFSQSMCLSPRS